MKEITLSQCSLTIANTVLKNITITACDIKHALAADDYAKIKVLSANLDIDALLNKPICIHLGETILYNGIIIKIKLTHHDDLPCTTLYIHSQLHPLKKNYHDRIFTKKNTIDILKSVLEPYAFQIEWHLKEKLFTYPLATQYQQSDFDFLQWTAARNGIYFYINNEKLIIADHYPEAKPIELPYIDQARLQATQSCIFELIKTNTLATQTMTLQDYNPITAHLNIKASNKDPHQTCGEWIYFDNQAQDPAIQKQLLIYQRERYTIQNQFLKIKTNNSLLTLNQLIKLSKHPNQRLNQYYRLVAIHHCFNNYYYNECTLLPAEHCFRPNIPKQRYFGLQTATVCAHNANTPNLNDHGHYQLKMPYQERPIDANLARNLLQLTGPYHGQHFPLHDQTTVLLAYINGEINNPVIIGSLTSDKNLDVVTNKNKQQHLLRTHSQQELCFNDDEHNPQLHLCNQQQQLILNTDLKLNSVDGQMTITAEQTIHHHSGGDFCQTIQGNSKTTIKNDYRLQAHTIQVCNQQNDILINTKQLTHCYAQHSDLLQKMKTQQIQTPNLTYQANTFDNQSLGYHESSAQTIVLTAESLIELSCGKSSLTLDSQGNIRIQSQTVEFHCKSLNNKTLETQFDMNKN